MTTTNLLSSSLVTGLACWLCRHRPKKTRPSSFRELKRWRCRCGLEIWSPDRPYPAISKPDSLGYARFHYFQEEREA